MRTTLYVQCPQFGAPLIPIAAPVKFRETDARDADVWWYGFGAAVLGIWLSLSTVHVPEYCNEEFWLSYTTGINELTLYRQKCQINQPLIGGRSLE